MRGVRVFVSRRDRDSALRWLAVLAVVLVGCYLAIRRYAPFAIEPRALREWIEGFGVWAPVAFVAVQAAGRRRADSRAGDELHRRVPVRCPLGFGLQPRRHPHRERRGFLSLSRRYGRSYVERVVTPETLARFDDITHRNALTSLFVAFLVPGMPDDVLCFVGGLTDEPVWKLVLVAVAFAVSVATYLNRERIRRLLATGASATPRR